MNSWDPPKLLAQSEQPLLLTFNCLNGYFVAPNCDSLAEAFMKAEGRGTIGAFSPSGLSVDGPAHRFHKALLAEIVQRRIREAEADLVAGRVEKTRSAKAAQALLDARKGKPRRSLR